ncbi:keratin, type I cytoskeletal 18-like [Corythoichthys intestinalis]|uniref:keratin, type I cytoskeletal 18-like n=1 Tax=Corythoichthys intestinalis TaxID=161448 RepID=UPI0025A68973|nr:keratin, type I cytoskeletal 18-like [Corythoichthys intestinalis]XP_061802775.1 keratin, type I cytoskeletal 18-like [Nerophis lumbriciformis]
MIYKTPTFSGSLTLSGQTSLPCKRLLSQQQEMERMMKKRNAKLLYAPTVYGGAGGRGVQISTSTSGSLVSSRYNDGHDYQSSGFIYGTLAIKDEKFALKQLNDRLANYMETVRSLEKANSQLDIKIREAIGKRGPLEGREYSKYHTIISDLKAKIIHGIKDNMQIAITLDNARLASDDFRIKMDYEIAMRQTVEADVAIFRKHLDDTNVIRLHLESDVESLKEELISLRKTHEIDIAELRAKTTQVGVRVDVDAPKGQNLAGIMEDMRAKYEKIIQKNAEEVKLWHESKIREVQVQVTEQSTALRESAKQLAEINKRYQQLEIERHSALSLTETLKATLLDTEMRYNKEITKYNEIILRLTEELRQIRAEIQELTRNYEHLFNIKVKLEAEIAEYRRLLEGENTIKLEDALKKTVETKVVTVTQTLVDGKVVSESKDVKSGVVVEP